MGSSPMPHSMMGDKFRRPQELAGVLQGGHQLVINGLVTPLNGIINGVISPLQMQLWATTYNQ